MTFCFLLGCSKKETVTKKNAILNSKSVSNTHTLLISQQEKDSIKYDSNYFFANDSVCNKISIKTLNKGEEDGIPKKLGFNLMLRNKKKNNQQINFKGIAVLTSSDESFFDKTENDGGDYFAADYSFSDTNYNLKIRLDIEKYEACVISIEHKGSKDLIKEYGCFVKKYPDYDVMKKGDCR
ncbi:hypothetical protein DB895_06200 [Flavobacterium psychrotolerans]|uniref:Uncharacterized protein n=2 Tax=Flavobacterium psychrotolerans TaxID=2169410 RepID=A0A2U1JKS0_9FLAO|nr:hypothetical protein DB895_06200 [Flavobacterium psychrotolerans]